MGEIVTRAPYRTGALRRAQIVKAAFAAFGTDGYHGASPRQVAAMVGVSGAAIQRHFSNKEALLQAVLDHWQGKSYEVASFDFRDLDGIRQLSSLMQFHGDHPGLLQLFITLAVETTSERHPAHELAVARYAWLIEATSGALRQAMADDKIALDPEDIDVQVRLLIAILDGLELQLLLDCRMDLVASFDVALEMLLLGCGSRSAAGIDPGEGEDTR